MHFNIKLIKIGKGAEPGLAYLDERAQVMLQALFVTFGDHVYDHPESTEPGHIHVFTINCTTLPLLVQEINLPETVDSNLMSLLGCCCENLKQLHQHRWKEVDDYMSLRGMQALLEFISGWKQRQNYVK